MRSKEALQIRILNLCDENELSLNALGARCGIQHIKITGVGTAVRLYHILQPASARHTAGLRRLSIEHTQQIVKIPVVLLVPRHGLLVPQVKGLL